MPCKEELVSTCKIFERLTQITARPASTAAMTTVAGSTDDDCNAIPVVCADDDRFAVGIVVAEVTHWQLVRSSTPLPQAPVCVSFGTSFPDELSFSFSRDGNAKKNRFGFGGDVIHFRFPLRNRKQRRCGVQG
ncbi:hypothetical protein Q1695_003798 [Nippostrongylus brasiliensis]|nr:hypothetical protein Q1695_003798 [Nippostrongylus brasiliensis]